MFPGLATVSHHIEYVMWIVFIAIQMIASLGWKMVSNLARMSSSCGSHVWPLHRSQLCTCVITVNDRMKCWGDNEYGQLGYGEANRVNNLPYIDLGKRSNRFF
eukprot:1352486-Amphidinium_carterae.1